MKIELNDKEIELLINSLETYLDCINFVDRTYKSEMVQKKTQEIIIDTALLSNKLYKEKEKEDV